MKTLKLLTLTLLIFQSASNANIYLDQIKHLNTLAEAHSKDSQGNRLLAVSLAIHAEHKAFCLYSFCPDNLNDTLFNEVKKAQDTQKYSLKILDKMTEEEYQQHLVDYYQKAEYLDLSAEAHYNPPKGLLRLLSPSAPPFMSSERGPTPPPHSV